MKPPATVQVGAYRYTVVCSKAAIDAVSQKDSSELSGMHLGEQQQIVIDPALGPDAMADTLLHEVLHACCYIAGIQHHKHEEEFVASVTGLLLDTLRRNKKLVAYLLEVT